MKRLNKILFIIIIMIGFLPIYVNAANADIGTFKLKCDKADDISPGEKVKCHILGIVTDATGTDKDIKYLVTRVVPDKAKITGAGTITGSYDSGLSYYYTKGGQAYSNNLGGARADGNCPAGSDCYDWYHSTAGVIKKDTSSPISTGQYSEANDFGWFEVEILANQIITDTDCAKICVYADRILDGETTSASVMPNPTVTNGGCMELHLTFPKYCVQDGTTYYDSNGNSVTEEEYLRDCFICQIRDNKYYDNTGRETTEEGYRAACGCRIDNGKYYGPNNNEITVDEYNRVCNPKCYCNNNGQCFDNNGKPVPEDEYKKACGCRIDNGKYYGPNNEEITEEEYTRVCNPKCYCDSNGQCYDDNGNPVTEEEYNKDCNPKCYCDSNGQCYDGKGKPVTPEQYQKACGCRKENGKFYDDKGNEVDEKTWNAKCVPGTGSFAPYISILTLLLASYGIINIIKYYKNNKKIYKV